MPLPPPTPPAGRVSVATDAVPPDFWEAVGYPPMGPRALRADILERLERELYKRASEGPLTAVPELAQMIGSTVEDLEGVLTAMGYRRSEGDGGTVDMAARTPAAPRREAPEEAGEADRETARRFAFRQAQANRVHPMTDHQ